MGTAPSIRFFVDFERGGTPPPISGRHFFRERVWQTRGSGELHARNQRHGSFKECKRGACSGSRPDRSSRQERAANQPTRLRDASKIDDGQMLALGELSDNQLESVAPRGASSWHSCPRLESSSRSRTLVERFLRSPAEQVGVGAGSVVPGGVGAELSTHGGVAEWDERQAPRALLFQGTDEAFDDADAQRFTEDAVTRTGTAMLAPAPEGLARRTGCRDR